MFKQHIAKVLAKNINLAEENIIELLEIPPEAELGDFAFPCFSLAKELKKAPAGIAEELAGTIKDDLIAEVKATGPYINFFLTKKAWLGILESELWEKTGSQKIMIEYPSPNTNKPLHLGHVRNMILGTTLARMLSTAGNEVLQVNLNNDRGVHICKSMLAYKLFGEGSEPDKKSDHFVGDWYVRFAKEAEKNPELNDQAQEMLRKWEEGDEEVRALWKKMNTWAFNGWKETFAAFEVSFDKEYYESEIYQEGKRIVLENKDKFVEEDGAIIANLDTYKLPKKVLLRSDGTSIYITQDIALTLDKIKDFGPDKQIWVVGNEQELHFRQLFALLDMLGTPKDTFYHLSYGMIELPDGKMKSREGTVVDADDLLQEMQALATKHITERHKDWSEEKINSTAKHVALGAIRFFIVKYDPLKNFVFDKEKSLSFEGDTGPYVQYTHARICSILRQSDENGNLDDLGEEEAIVCKEILKLTEAFKQGTEQYKPHLIAQQLLQVSRAVNTYYHATPVLKAEENIRAARLTFLRHVKEKIAQGLNILGIQAIEEM